MYDFTEKVALITGAGRETGIGAAIARRLACEGASVALADICASPSELPHSGNPAWEELEKIAATVEGESNVVALPLRVDVADAQSVRAMFARVRDRFGRLDILVNNAGVAIGPAPVLHMQEAAWRRTLEVNATGAFLCCKYGLPLLLETGGDGGRIVNVASIAATKPKPFVSAYAAGKAAMVALTRSLAQEVADAGITVNAILPGDVDTEMKQWGLQLESAVTGEEQEQVVAGAVARIPLGRLGTPADVAALVAFLVSDQADFITGQAYNLTGGRELT